MGPLALILVGGLLYFQVDGKLSSMPFFPKGKYEAEIQGHFSLNKTISSTESCSVGLLVGKKLNKSEATDLFSDLSLMR